VAVLFELGYLIFEGESVVVVEGCAVLCQFGICLFLLLFACLSGFNPALGFDIGCQVTGVRGSAHLNLLIG
jgi:hypothetical protein